MRYLTRRAQNGFCLFGINKKDNICEGDQGGPATYAFNGREYLGGIAAYDLPKVSFLGRNETICGPQEGFDKPTKFVRMYHFVHWLLRDHSFQGQVKPLRMEIVDCLVNRPADLNSAISNKIRPS